MDPLTKRQKQTLDYIEQFIGENGYAPSYREIADYFKLSSVATVAEHIDSLTNKGYLNREANEARSLQLTPTWDEQSFSAPLMGIIAAGAPIQAVRTHETIDIPRDMMGPKVFALRVKGNSMIEDGIFDGDYVIIEQTTVAKNGDIVVALIDRENVTLKRFYQEKTHIRLQPANKTMKPILTKNVTVQGKVKGVIRKF
ncbi:MAG: transcriptional repressor LexA [Patescibacteria group bacterium]